MDRSSPSPAMCLDATTTALMLLSLPYNDVLSISQKHPKYQLLMDNNFWISKLKMDYQLNYDGSTGKNPHQEYYHAYDLIRSDDEIEERLRSRLIEIETTSNDQVKVHFSGGFVSDLQGFGALSNKLRIGVIARSKTFARAALRLLRFHEIDFNPMYDYAVEIMREDNVPLTYTNLILTLAEQESSYVKDYPLDITFTMTSLGGETLTRLITEIDLWTLERTHGHMIINVSAKELGLE